MTGNQCDCRTCVNARILRTGRIDCQLPFDPSIPIVFHKQFPKVADDGVYFIANDCKNYLGDECKHHIKHGSSSNATFFLEDAMRMSQLSDALMESDRERALVELGNAKAMAENAVDDIVRRYRELTTSRV